MLSVLRRDLSKKCGCFVRGRESDISAGGAELRGLWSILNRSVATMCDVARGVTLLLTAGIGRSIGIICRVRCNIKRDNHIKAGG